MKNGLWLLIRLLLGDYQPKRHIQFIVKYWSKLNVILDLDCWNQSRSRQKIFLSRSRIIIGLKNCPFCCWTTIVVHLSESMIFFVIWSLFPFIALAIYNWREFGENHIAGYRSPYTLLSPPRPMWTRDPQPCTMPMGKTSTDTWKFLNILGIVW